MFFFFPVTESEWVSLFKSQLLSLLRVQRTKNTYCVLSGNTIFKQLGENQSHSFFFFFFFPRQPILLSVGIWIRHYRMGCLILATIQVYCSCRVVIY